MKESEQILIDYKKFIEQFHTKETIRSYLHKITYFLSANPRAVQYSYEDIVQHLGDFKKAYTNESTRVLYLGSIKRFYDFLLHEGKIEDHPCKNLFIRTQRKPIQTQKLFTGEELEMLFERENKYENLKYRNNVLIGLLIYQGLRAEEVERIRLEDCNLDEGMLNVRKTKTSNERRLELKPRQIVHIMRYLERARPKLLKRSTDKLLLTYQGTALKVDTMSRVFKSLQSLFPVKNLNPTTIRQSVIYNWLNVKNYPLGDVQIMAGHRYPSSTEKYLTNDMEGRIKLINRYYPIK